MPLIDIAPIILALSALITSVVGAIVSLMTLQSSLRNQAKLEHVANKVQEVKIQTNGNLQEVAETNRLLGNLTGRNDLIAEIAAISLNAAQAKENKEDT